MKKKVRTNTNSNKELDQLQEHLQEHLPRRKRTLGREQRAQQLDWQLAQIQLAAAAQTDNVGTSENDENKHTRAT